MSEWTIPGQALSSLMIVRRDAASLKYGEAGMFPGEQDIDQPRTDLFFCQKGLQELVAKQQHDLDRIGPGNREKSSAGRNEAIGDETVKVGVKAGRIIAVGLD